MSVVLYASANLAPSAACDAEDLLTHCLMKETPPYSILGLSMNSLVSPSFLKRAKEESVSFAFLTPEAAPTREFVQLLERLESEPTYVGVICESASTEADLKRWGCQKLYRSPRPLVFRPATPAPEVRIATLLRRLNERLTVIEATTGGLISSRLLSVPGASSYFIAGSIVYTGRGAKRLLPETVLRESGLFDRDANYRRGMEAYVESKRKFAEIVSEKMRLHHKANWCLVESGTTGPDFKVLGVDRPFTAAGVAREGFAPIVKVCVVHDHVEKRATRREENMRTFADFALWSLLEVLQEAVERMDDSRL